MEYKELRNILCAAAAEHKTIEAFVSFTPSSFSDGRLNVIHSIKELLDLYEQNKS